MTNLFLVVSIQLKAAQDSAELWIIVAAPVITDFEDDFGEGTAITMPDIGSGVDKARFKMKVRQFIQEHEDHIALIKLRRAEQLTKQDLEELGRILIDLGVADDAFLAGLDAEGGVARFLRSLTGLYKAATKAAFSEFVGRHQLSADQVEFLDMVIDSLTESGFVDPASFYESPFTDFDDMGIAGVFNQDQTREIIQIVKALNEVAAA
jgi:type I restriction enzyme R subunit